MANDPVDPDANRPRRMEQEKSAYEDQLKTFRTTRKLIRINKIPFKVTRNAFESALREKLSNSDSPRIFWPPVDKAKLPNPARHLGWELEGSQLGIDRASRVANTSGSSGKRIRSADSGEASTTAPSVASPLTTATFSGPGGWTVTITGPSTAASPAVPTPTAGNTTAEAALLPAITPENAPAAVVATGDAHAATNKRKLDAHASEDAHDAEVLPAKKMKVDAHAAMKKRKLDTPAPEDAHDAEVLHTKRMKYDTN
ncbi:unnamed protein product [Clonostachys byssicola]|uniref:Uncharacterized protein n=1 Tax=Clonostachys byssicola TaxID=160290 RepID=A0A9N9U4T1_9HYPO|nr:unnamed protein product [Clonostachys byssicola]